MADLKNCPECGRLFAADSQRKVCSRCMEKEDSEYAIVRKYVRDNPGAGIFEVSEATGIEEEKILQFLKQGRLQTQGFVEVANCERCGKKTVVGKYCEECRKQVNKELKAALPQAPNPAKSTKNPKDKMYLKE